MRSSSANPNIGCLLSLVFALVFLPGGVRADWLKIDPPPDVDKAAHGHVGKPSCWLATAANMLAGAGYGDGSTVQARADDIYGELVNWCVTQYGLIIGGWSDQAITWWLDSGHNKWKTTNPYRAVDVSGWTEVRPWDPSNGAGYIQSELGDCAFVGLSICWPRETAGGSPEGGHALTCWGGLSTFQVKVTDSDSDWTGDVQTYTYDPYANPNPGGYNEGNGWYFDYINTPSNHPFIRHIVTLRPIGDPTANILVYRAVGSYQIHQASSIGAVYLYFRVYSSSRICSPDLALRINIDWPTGNAPTIQVVSEKELRVSYDLNDNPVPNGTCVTITCDFVLEYEELGNYPTLSYSDVYFGYPLGNVPQPGFGWYMVTSKIPDANIPNIRGGYVIGGFDLFEDPGGTDLIGQYRFQHQYAYFQDPEFHELVLEAEEPNETYFVGNFRFGHSYGLLDPNSLWQYDEWMTEELAVRELDYTEIVLDWEGQLPYPDPGEYIPSAQPSVCGDPGTVFLPQDLNHDCHIDFRDFALFTQHWLECSDPNNPDCDIYWEQPRPNPVAHWKLDQRMGTIALDSSGYGNHGLLIGDPCWVTGRVGEALLFDGVGDYVDCGSVGISGNAARTIAGWAKASTTTIPDWTTVFGFAHNGVGSNTYFDIERDALGNYVLHVYGRPEAVFCTVDPNWHHFAAAHDGNGVSWYLDGSSVGTASGWTLSTVDHVRMGLRMSLDNYFPGLVDDVRIYNRALNSEEIAALCGVTPDLVVPAATTVTKDSPRDFGKFAVAGRLIVQDGADLTFTRQSYIDGVPATGIRPEIIVNGGSLHMDARLDMGTNKADNGGNDAYLTMNGGYFRVGTEASTGDSGDLKLPDDDEPIGPHRIYLNGGLLRVHRCEVYVERDAIIYLGGGIMEIEDLSAGDPKDWKAQGGLLPAGGYTEVVIDYNEPVPGGARVYAQ